jgi:hypothetical protein
MAKKVVATFQTGSGKDYTKVIRMARSAKSGAYVFKENIVPNDAGKNFLASADK